MRLFPTAVLASCAALALPVLVPPASATEPQRGAVPECHIAVRDSEAGASCHNPGPEPVHVQLHIKCRRWWDPAVDSRPVEVSPARTVVLADHCWKEIEAVWVTRR